MPDQHEHVKRYIKHERLALAQQKNPHLKWPTQPTNLAQDLIVGLFDFTPRKPSAYLPDGPPEPARIANAHWSVLEDRAHEFNIDTSTIRQRPTANTDPNTSTKQTPP